MFSYTIQSFHFRVFLLVLFVAGGMRLSARPPSYTLNPPENLQLEAVECNAYATWDSPEPSTSPGLLGYRVYRDGTYLGSVSGQDTTWFYDFTVMQGYHVYSVSAFYDLAPYGYPGYFDESEQAGPADITIICSSPPYLCEDWYNGFQYYGWVFIPSQGNWAIDVANGYPAPSAGFTGLPADTDYTYSLSYTYLFSAIPICAVIPVDYDIRLVTVNPTGEEHLSVELYYHDQWHLLDVFSNSASFDWEHHHYEVPDAWGETMKIRFRAYGENSTDISCWNIDNICLNFYNPAWEAPSGFLEGQNIILTWSPPPCTEYEIPPLTQEEIFYYSTESDTSILQPFEGVFGTVFDLSDYPLAWLKDLDFHHAFSGTGYFWKYRIHVVDWISQTEMATIGPLFTTVDGGWEEGISLDSLPGLGGGIAGIFIQPMGNTPDNAFPRLSADNSGPQETSLAGSFPDYSSLSPSSIGNYLMKLHILIPDTIADAGNPLGPHVTTSLDSIKYQVYRRYGDMQFFQLLTQELISDTAFTDTDPPLNYPAVYYRIGAILYGSNGSSHENISDTLEVVITSIPGTEKPILSIFPNPAFKEIHVISSAVVMGFRLMDSQGRVWKQEIPGSSSSFSVSISDLPEGLYFAVFDTDTGQVIRKVVVLDD